MPADEAADEEGPEPEGDGREAEGVGTLHVPLMAGDVASQDAAPCAEGSGEPQYAHGDETGLAGEATCCAEG